MKRRTWLRLTRKLHKAFNPVDLGQTRGGLILVAVLIAGWQLSAPARADYAHGYSGNDYFRLEWFYDTRMGFGWMHLDRQTESWWIDLILDRMSFNTAGTPFTEITWNGQDVFGPPTYMGNQNGLPLYEYSTLEPLLIPNQNQSPIVLEVTFNPENAALRVAEMSYEGYVTSSPSWAVPIQPTPLPFVTIQTIPEPSAVATALLAATALATFRRREDE